MANLYLDSSALVKRYAHEAGSGWVLNLFRPVARNSIYLSKITPVETVAGLAMQSRMGVLSIEDLNKAMRRINLASARKFIIVDLTDMIVKSAISLVPKHGLRGYDAIQLATAISISSNLVASRMPALVFVSGDKGLNKAASIEGLTVENPNDHP